MQGPIVLGINSYFENPSAALVVGNDVVFAAEDERFTGVKHGRRYSPHRTYVPFLAIDAALRTSGVAVSDIDQIAHSFSRVDHVRSLWRAALGRRGTALRDEIAGEVAVGHYKRALEQGFEVPDRLWRTLQPERLGRIPLTNRNHHAAHAASAFYVSGFADALTIVCDGGGEAAATTIWRGKGRELVLQHAEAIPNSLGKFYTYVTRHLGFDAYADEFKVMGLAAYGEPTVVPELQTILRLRPNGGYAVNMRRLENLGRFLGPERRPSEPVDQRHMDIARSAQAVLEDALCHVTQYWARALDAKRLCLAGGTFLNCVANGKVAAMGTFEDVFVQPAASDAGTALGAAILGALDLGAAPQFRFGSAALGTEYSDDEIRAVLSTAGIDGAALSDAELVNALADRLARGEICGLFRGRMEFGPRALGNRSVLADPGDPAMRDRLNVAKGREAFRPVAPMVVAERFHEYFIGHENRYMLFTSRVQPAARTNAPSAVHIDGTARVQNVDASEEPFLHDLLSQFGERTGTPMLINTSLNARGRPIVEHPADALACFFTSGMDCIALGPYLIDRRVDQRPLVTAGFGNAE